MAPGLDPQALLQRVLLLERQQGFGDRAAVGGLARFSAVQLNRAGTAPAPQLVGAVRLLAAYDRGNRHDRERAVAAALETLLAGTPQGSATASTRPQPLERPIRARPTDFDLAGLDAAASPPLPRTRRKPYVVRTADEVNGPVSSIKGIRKPALEALERLGVMTVRDLLYHFPRTHYDYTDTRSISRMRIGQKTTLVGTIRDVRVNRTARNITITTVTITDDTGTVGVRWFNQPYLGKSLSVGKRIAISGEPDVFNSRITFTPRDYELIEDTELTHTARLVPIYPLTKGLFQRSFRSMMRRVVEEYSGALDDFLPLDVQKSMDLPHLSEAVHGYHFPADEEDCAHAQQRLAFDELFLIQLGLLMRKREWQESSNSAALPVSAELLARYYAGLPFAPTSAQRRVIDEILADLSQSHPMSRLLQGDVGAGKTVVAAAALLETVAAGKQGLLMAPTEILAEQHLQTLQRLLGPFNVRCELLTGSVSKGKKRDLYTAAAEGTIDVLVGTHALITEGVQLAGVGLAITDEQHRFGVEQRATLRSKGIHPHTLAMTATPIPRTLALTIYGDLDVSSLDEMPPGRIPVITTWCRTPHEAYGVVRSQVQAGRQAFVICPVIEESADSDMRSVLAEHRELQNLVFPELRVGLLHGRMRPKEKEEALHDFRRGDFEVLVATSVVEVGIDIPNATVMVIRDAHRFGLAQLHQFRGRVGRAGDQAYCVLLSSAEGDNARDRLEALTAMENGFELAEEDLRLRGPGEFWGVRQSGLPALRVAQLGDVETIELARRAATSVLAEDEKLEAPHHVLLRRQVQHFWRETADLS